MTIKTDYPKNFTKAENDLFKWCDSWNDTILHKPSNKGVRRSALAKDDLELDAEVKAAAIEFWAELDALKKAEEEAKWSNESLNKWNKEREAYSPALALLDDMDSEDSDY